MNIDHEPPYPLSEPARAIWDRHAVRLHAEGRLHRVDRDALCRYCETSVIYAELSADVARFGTTIEGRQGPVKNPALSPLASARDSLGRLAGELPLYVPTVAASDDVESFLAGLGLDGSVTP